MKPSLNKKMTFLLRCLIPLLLAVSYGCGSDEDTVTVDFSKTVPVKGQREGEGDPHLLRVGVAAMVSPKETFDSHRKVLDYIGRHVGKRIEFIQRKTYGEINELFSKGGIDLAFICSGPYAAGKEKYGFELIATPQIRGSHFYRSYLIVNKKSPFYLLKDLKGKVFAFTDPESNTGKLVPTYWLARMGETPEVFFAKTIYTYSHDNSILAVAKGLVDGAAVDSLVWDYYNTRRPDFTSGTRIIKKSEPYGVPPLVASANLPGEMKARIRKLVLTMHTDPEGRAILEELMVDRFVSPLEEWYGGIRKMRQELGVLKKEIHALSEPKE